MKKLGQEIFRAGLVAFLAAAFTGAIWSQTTTTGDITGTVMDTTNAVVAGAKVTLRNVDTGDTRVSTTSTDGTYRFSFLRPGDYVVAAETTGLKSDTSRITVQVGQIAQVNLIAKVQATQEVIEVTTQAQQLNVENANLSDTFSSKQMEELPAPGGDITSIAFTAPGVVVSTGMGYGNFSSHGLPGTSNLYTINGNDYNDPFLNLNNSGASNLTLGQNEIQEAAVVQNAYSAQYGRNAGAQVNYTTKSGTNAYHGDLLYNWNGDMLNANSFFNNANGVQRPRAISNQWGASLGGKIIKDKLFFFVDNEGIRYTLPSSGVISMPSQQLQSYMLSTLPSSSLSLYKQAFGVYNNAPGANAAVPVTNGGGNLQDATNRMGCGNFASTNTAAPGGGIFGATVPCADAYATNGSNTNREWLLTTRIDYNISDSQKLNFRFKHDGGFQPTSTDLLNPVFSAQSIQPQYEGQVNWTWVVSPTQVNNFIASALYYSAIFGPANDTAALSAFPSAFFFGDGGANGGGFYNMGANWSAFPQGRNVSQGQLIDDYSIVHGNHTIKFGANYRENRVSDHGLTIGTNGYYFFSSLTDFVQGVTDPNTFSYYFQQNTPLLVAHTRLYNAGFYVQDEWQAKPNIKVTVGLRLDRTGNPTCTDNCFNNLATQFTANNFPGTANSPYNSVINAGGRQAYYAQDAIVPQPRLGVVWSPRQGTNSTVIRGGVGLFADLAPGVLLSSIYSNPPVPYGALVYDGSTVGGVGSTAPGSAPLAAVNEYNAFRNGFSNGATLTQLGNTVPGFAPPNAFSIPSYFATPEYLEWSFEIQQAIGTKNTLTLTYAGNHGYNLFIQNGFANAAVNTGNFPNGFGGLPLTQRDPAFGTVTQLSNSGISNYNGLTVSYRRLLGYGFQGEFSYTYSHALDNVSNGGILPFSFQPGAGFTSLSSPSVANNYGNADYDIRHNFVADFVWDMPYKFSNRMLSEIASGWTLSGKLFIRSGLPFSVYDSQLGGLVSPFLSGTILASYAGGAVNHSCGPGAVNNACFTTSQFVPYGQEKGFGNVGRNSFYGPGYTDVDMSLYKNFSVTEHATLTIGMSAYNMFNHPNFQSPNANVAGGGFGLITANAIPPTSAYGAFQGSAVSGRVVVLTGRVIF